MPQPSQAVARVILTKTKLTTKKLILFCKVNVLFLIEQINIHYIFTSLFKSQNV
jgi:hypothetical protein